MTAILPIAKNQVVASALRANQRVNIADTLMQFYYWQGDIPVFTYMAEGIQINYINHDFNRDTVFELK